MKPLYIPSKNHNYWPLKSNHFFSTSPYNTYLSLIIEKSVLYENPYKVRLFPNYIQDCTQNTSLQVPPIRNYSIKQKHAILLVFKRSLAKTLNKVIKLHNIIGEETSSQCALHLYPGPRDIYSCEHHPIIHSLSGLEATKAYLKSVHSP